MVPSRCVSNDSCICIKRFVHMSTSKRLGGIQEQVNGVVDKPCELRFVPEILADTDQHKSLEQSVDVAFHVRAFG
jgi:hypothetical protein